ncbi:MAG: hypothetical protein C0434_08045 [Xanthomonadaceae bacterium]|nr:hypothetical protein [Xanthomonadaceae bacterium]
MGTIAASVILNRAAKTLLDETGVTWQPSELLDYLRAGINAVFLFKQDCSTRNVPHALAAGSKQAIPQDGTQALDVVRNLGPAGATPGAAIRQVERETLDRDDPNWHTATGPQVLHVTFDKRDPRTFYVYPRPPGAWSVELVYAAHPQRIESASDVLPIDDLYETPLHAYVVAYAYFKNAKRGDVAKSQAYLGMFTQMIGAKSAAQFQFAPLPSPVDSQKDR